MLCGYSETLPARDRRRRCCRENISARPTASAACMEADTMQHTTCSRHHAAHNINRAAAPVGHQPLRLQVAPCMLYAACQHIVCCKSAYCMLHAAAVLVGQNSEVVRLELSHELAAVEQPLVQRTHAQQQHIVLPLQRQLCLVHHRHHLPSTARSKYCRHVCNTGTMLQNSTCCMIVTACRAKKTVSASRSANVSQPTACTDCDAHCMAFDLSMTQPE